MLFNSLEFLVFLAVVYGLYLRLRRRGQNVLLLAASYFFYGWWDWRFCSLLLFSTVLDFYLGRKIHESSDERHRKIFVAISVVSNLGMLGFFKYFNFFSDSFRAVLEQIGFYPSWVTLNIILPVGISFYTFQTLSYCIDIYRRHLTPARSIVDFALFVAFFPQLVAGPIERAAFLLPQMQVDRTIRRDAVLSGLWLIALGFVKKVVIADQLARFVSLGFAGQDPTLHGASNWIFLYAFAFQIYGDFSGYSDIARGLSRLMGFELSANFGRPYLVTNPADFWKHWHISLSTWLRDYLYIPLGGNRGGVWMTYRNLAITMLLGGLWHGASWAFVIWGAYQGALLIVHRLAARTTGAPRPHAPLVRSLQVVGMFHLVCIGWLFFRAASLPAGIDAPAFIGDMLVHLALPIFDDRVLPYLLPVLLFSALALVLQALHARMTEFHLWPSSLRILSLIAACALIGLFGVTEGAEFIYFQF